MHVDAEIRYPATPAQVAQMLADSDFVEGKCVAMGATQHTVLVEPDASGAFTVTSSRTMPTDDFPDVARKFVGSTVTIRQVDAWQEAGADGAREGTISVEIVGAPLKMTGGQWLRPDGPGCVQVVDGELKASVPLVGGKLEKAAEPAIRMAIRTEDRVGHAWLAERAG